MKAILFAFSVLALPLCISAQENEAEDIITLDEQTKFRKNEIGFVTQAYMGQVDYPGGILIGANYKRRVSQMVSYRVLGGFTPYQQHRQSGITSIKQDTIFRNMYFTDVDAGFLGFGIEVQRKFYKRVYLYAALELLGGYGQGEYDKGQIKEKYDNNNNMHTYHEGEFFKSEDYKIAFLNFHPAIGSKIVFKKINFGLEISAFQFSNQIAKLESDSSWGFRSDFNLFSTSILRIFANYTF